MFVHRAANMRHRTVERGLFHTKRFNLNDFCFNRTYKKHSFFYPEGIVFHKQMINPMKEIHYIPQVLKGTQL